MAYDMFLGDMQFPFVPSSITVKQSGKSKTLTLINEGEVNVLKTPGLQEISFEALLPNTSGAGVNSDGAESYKEELDGMLAAGVPVQFILNRQLPNGSSLFSTNIKVSIESISYKDDVNNGFDIMASITLKEYKAYGTKVVQIMTVGNKQTASASGARDDSSAPVVAGAYQVNSGDSLWKIAKEKYGDGNKWKDIAAANKGTISNPNKIYPGQSIVLP